MQFLGLIDTRGMRINPRRFTLLLAPLILMSGCTPTVQVKAPSEPITINLNVKIDHEVRVRVEKDLDSVISKDSGLF